MSDRYTSTTTDRRLLLGGLASTSAAMLFGGPARSATADAIRPGDDFYLHVNAAELQTRALPPGAWERGNFDIVGERVASEVEALIKAARPDSRRAHEARVGSAYRAMLNDAGIEAGATRRKGEVVRILAAPTPDAVAAIMAHPRSSSLVGFYVAPTAGDWLLNMDQQSQVQPMLGLPGAHYEGADDRSVEIRRAYLTCIESLLSYAGATDGARRAADVLALETEVHRRLWSPERLRDRRANLHLMSVDELNAFAPGFPWSALLAARGVADVARLNLGTDTAVAAQARLFAETPLDSWRSWLAFSWIRNGIETAPRAWRDAYWRFAGEVHRGGARPSREAEASRFLHQRLPMDVGRLYSEARFPEGHKRQIVDVLSYLKRAMAERLNRASWLDQPSRKEALAKLDAMTMKAGYPTRWPDAPPGLSAVDAAANYELLLQHDWRRQLRNLHDPESRKEVWYQAPQFVNASYSVLFNAIEVPAAILQPPFFHPGGDPARNFGAIGAIVGHEIGHAFDDQGLLYDSRGVLRDWMSASSQSAFEARTERLVSQIDAQEPLPGVRLNGRRSVGEAASDLTGVLLALRAYELWRVDHKPRESLDQGRRTLFRSWAEVWSYKATDDAIRHLAAHSYTLPAPYRVNLTLSNIDEWYATFGVKSGDKLFIPPDRRVRLW